MSGAGASMASEARLDEHDGLASLGWVPQRTAGVPAMYGMYRRRVFFSYREAATVATSQPRLFIADPPLTSLFYVEGVF